MNQVLGDWTFQQHKVSFMITKLRLVGLIMKDRVLKKYLL